MAQGLRVLAAFAEDLNSIPKHLWGWGTLATFLLASSDAHMHVHSHTYTQVRITKKERLEGTDHLE